MGVFLFAKEGETNKETVKTRIFRLFHFHSTATFSYTQEKIVLPLILLVKIRMSLLNEMKSWLLPTVCHKRPSLNLWRSAKFK